MFIPLEYFLQRDNQNTEKNFDINYSDEESLQSKLFPENDLLKKTTEEKDKEQNYCKLSTEKDSSNQSFEAKIKLITNKPKEDNHDSLNRILFKTKKRNRPGRKGNINHTGKKCHKSTANDNILSKIQIHFLNFLVNFANDAIKTEFTDNKKNLNFKNLKYAIKCCIKKDHLNKLKQSPINYILQMKISTKYKNYSDDENYNKKIYNKIVNESKWLKDLFNMNFLKAFKIYYNDCKALKDIDFQNKRIDLSKRTKSFSYKYNRANKKEQIKLKKKVEEYYLKENVKNSNLLKEE